MRGMFRALTIALLILLLLPAWGCSSCSKQTNAGDADADVLPDIETEVDAGVDPVVDTADVPDDPAVDPEEEPDAADDVEDDFEDTFDLPDLPSCGDFTVDPGEECDDGNRLNGDGCDWLCQLGDGDPPGPPSSRACRYQSMTGPVVLENLEPDVIAGTPFPFVWTGSEFAAVFTEYSPVTTRFRRFSASGHQIGTDYTLASPGSHFFYPELIWTGWTYRFFYSDYENGIWYVSLSSDGAPLLGPILIVADPMAGMPAADNTEDGFVLVWESDGPDLGGWNYCNEPTNEAVKIQRFGPSGETAGYPGPITIWDVGMGPPDVATGPEGFGVVFMDHVEPNFCYTRFVHVSEDLSTVMSSAPY